MAAGCCAWSAPGTAHVSASAAAAAATAGPACSQPSLAALLGLALLCLRLKCAVPAVQPWWRFPSIPTSGGQFTTCPALRQNQRAPSRRQQCSPACWGTSPGAAVLTPPSSFLTGGCLWVCDGTWMGCSVWATCRRITSGSRRGTGRCGCIGYGCALVVQIGCMQRCTPHAVVAAARGCPWLPVVARCACRYLPFWDQFSHSMRLWSPCSSAFCFSSRGRPSGGVNGAEWGVGCASRVALCQLIPAPASQKIWGRIFSSSMPACLPAYPSAHLPCSLRGVRGGTHQRAGRAPAGPSRRRQRPPRRQRRLAPKPLLLRPAAGGGAAAHVAGPRLHGLLELAVAQVASVQMAGTGSLGAGVSVSPACAEQLPRLTH